MKFENACLYNVSLIKKNYTNTRSFPKEISLETHSVAQSVFSPLAMYFDGVKRVLHH